MSTDQTESVALALDNFCAATDAPKIVSPVLIPVTFIAQFLSSNSVSGILYQVKQENLVYVSLLVTDAVIVATCRTFMKLGVGDFCRT
jgi:hypothetical protein